MQIDNVFAIVFALFSICEIGRTPKSPFMDCSVERSTGLSVVESTNYHVVQQLSVSQDDSHAGSLFPQN